LSLNGSYQNFKLKLRCANNKLQILKMETFIFIFILNTKQPHNDLPIVSTTVLSGGKPLKYGGWETSGRGESMVREEG
jgi:hypothetical protein